jgi:hypothetical protein
VTDRRDADDGGQRWDRWDPTDDDDDPVVAATALLVLGLGLASLFGLVPVGPFWAVFAVGFAVVVPLVSILRDYQRGSPESATGPSPPEVGRSADSDDTVDDALDRLRDRYARGELTEEQFEEKLETLLETETPEGARDRLRRRETETRGTDTGRESTATSGESTARGEPDRETET